MTTYFLDTSALIKRYISEQGSLWIEAVCDPAQQNMLYISQATRVEIVSAICHRAREHSITLDEHNELIQKFREDSQKDTIPGLSPQKFMMRQENYVAYIHYALTILYN